MEHHKRIQKLQQQMTGTISGLLLYSNINQYYYFGEILGGYAFIPSEGEPIFFLQRGTKENAVTIRKVEDIGPWLESKGIKPSCIGLEEDYLSASDYKRIAALFDSTYNVTPWIRAQRSIKTAYELEIIKNAAKAQAQVYTKVPSLYTDGMTDRDFEVAIFSELLKAGHLGLFRCFGLKNEVFIGTTLVGENAAVVSPVDFALGGKGHPSLPIGADGTLIADGKTVMVDNSFNLSGYLTDMTRVYYRGKLPQRAIDAHNVSIEIQDQLSLLGKAGVTGAQLYSKALEIVAKHGLEDCFMGTEFQSKFVGHGVGLEINEPPVLYGRNNSPLEANMVIAIEPKFVITGVGAVGTENTFVVTEKSLEKITLLNEEMINLLA